MNVIVLDIECDNVDPLDPKLVGMGYKFDTDPIGYYPDKDKLLELDSFKDYLESPNYLKVCHNLKFELSYLKSLGINMVPPYYCTMVALWVLGMGKEHIETTGKKTYRYNLKDMAEKHCGYTEPKTFKQLAKEYPVYTPTGLFKKNGDEKMKKSPGLASNIPVGVLSEYCRKDVEMTYKLYQLTEPLLKTHGLDKLFYRVEMPLVPIFADMERAGLLIDAEYLRKFADRLDGEIKQIEIDMGKMI